MLTFYRNNATYESKRYERGDGIVSVRACVLEPCLAWFLEASRCVHGARPGMGYPAAALPQWRNDYPIHSSRISLRTPVRRGR